MLAEIPSHSRVSAPIAPDEPLGLWCAAWNIELSTPAEKLDRVADANYLGLVLRSDIPNCKAAVPTAHPAIQIRKEPTTNVIKPMRNETKRAIAAAAGAIILIGASTAYLYKGHKKGANIFW
ncbi:MAG: hypothetical protein ABSA33_00190 [Candidatus Micrarchaeaceae archaeon]|jgi:hypothetical protein